MMNDKIRDKGMKLGKPKLTLTLWIKVEIGTVHRDIYQPARLLVYREEGSQLDLVPLGSDQGQEQANETCDTVLKIQQSASESKEKVR